MRKFYGIYGRTTAVMKIEVNGGKAFFECEFNRGNPNPGAYYRPATYVTSSKVEQDIIENSPLFPSIIKLVRVVGEPEPEAKQTKAPEVTEYPEIEDREGAVALLKSLGATASVLTSDEAMKKFMVKKRIAFPNFSF